VEVNEQSYGQSSSASQLYKSPQGYQSQSASAYKKSPAASAY